MTPLVNSVVWFLPWWSANGGTLSPICMASRITLKARFTLSVKAIFSSKLVEIKFKIACSTQSTSPVPVYNLSGLCSISMLLLLWNNLFLWIWLQYHCLISFCPGPHKGWWNFPKTDQFVLLGWYTLPNYGPFTIFIVSDKNMRVTGIVSSVHFAGKFVFRFHRLFH